MNFYRLIILGILLTVVPHASAQETDPVLAKAASVMGSARVKSLRFSVAGSGYEVGPDKTPSTWKHIQIGTRTLEIDVDKLSLSKDGRIVTTESPWQEQFDLWAAPHVFVKKAATSSPFFGEWKKGDELYNLVIFKVGENLVGGYFNSQNLLEIVETKVQHPLLGETTIQTVYSEYKDFSGVKFPMTIIQKIGGSLTSILIVSNVQVQ